MTNSLLPRPNRSRRAAWAVLALAGTTAGVACGGSDGGSSGDQQIGAAAEAPTDTTGTTMQLGPAEFDFEQCLLTLAKPGEDPSLANDACIAQRDQANGTPGGDATSRSPQFSADPVTRGKYLSLDACEGTGSKELGSPPMHPEDIGTILPYGLAVGGHVTPVDHQYYTGKDPNAAPDAYEVLAPADGVVTRIEYRDRSNETGPVKGDYRVVIAYSCTFFSYFDLATSLSDDIASQLPAGWESTDHIQSANIPVTEGQVLGYVGGQTLDFAVWDTTEVDPGFLVQRAYDNMEPWKVHTVAPLDFFTDEVDAQLVPLYVRKAEPLDGRIGYDIDGTASGNWFAQGTNGYIGYFRSTDGEQSKYYTGHLSIAPDFLDPEGWVFSTGELAGSPAQFSMKAPTPAPDALTVASGPVKYELHEWRYVDESGRSWVSGPVAGQVRQSHGAFAGTALVQLVGPAELKVQVFPGMAPAAVGGFDDGARTYTRGADATIMMP